MFSDMQGKLIVFSAPSGSGKTSVISALKERIPNFGFSVSATSRPPRGDEQDGRDYFFLSPDEFRSKIERGDFLEYAQVYKDTFYGTLRSQVEAQLEEGRNIVLDVDVEGGLNIKKIYGKRALLIFIMAPSIEELRRRLEQRATDSKEVINMRLQKAEYEMSFAPRFDVVIVNDRLDRAVEQAYGIVNRFLDQ